MSIISIIILLILIGVALYLVQVIPMDATIKVVLKVLVIAGVVIWLLANFVPALTGLAPVHLK